MKKGKRGKGKGERERSNLKALVLNMNTAKLSHYVSNQSSFLFSILKNKGFIHCGEKLFILSFPFPLTLSPFPLFGVAL
uniref:Uncharacterized protein n=1 Tax=Nostoc flagelliforme str. Sunitezuoqi TaxID=676037 RepID=E7DQ81_9NOSO|nr:hypothetical protein Nfla_7704 [Nostoc flagelliforme str. Sunitezuoqi]